MGAPEAPEKKLNFVFILIDDMGWTDLACYGSKFYETPNIDKLASEGVRFTDAYAACPVCSPTRGSILTGRYPASTGVTDWLPGFSTRPDHKVLQAKTLQQLPLSEVTIAEALKPHGYVSASIGKWHLGGPKYFPDQQGFDVNVGGTSAGMAKSHFCPESYGATHLKGPDGEYLADRLTREAEGFIEKNRDNPFFLYLAHYAVHIPIEGRPDLVEKFKSKAKDGELHANWQYAAMVESVDESVGRVLKKLEDCGIADRTVIIFTSDNGGLCTESRAAGVAMSNLPLRQGKAYLYEGGIRVPLAIKWPGVTRPKQTCYEPVSSVDFLPTIMEMAGVKQHSGPALDGVSLAPLLKRTGKLNRDAIYWHYPHYCISENPVPMIPSDGKIGGRPSGAIRSGDYKLIEFYEDGRTELYNLKDDIGEQHDLAREKPEKAAEMRDMFAKWRESVGAKMPTPNPDYGSD